jgi:exosome complex component CSL4
MSTIAIPGQVLGTTATHNSGPGTHIFESKIYASIIGSVVNTPAAIKSSKATITIPRDAAAFQAALPIATSSLPAVGTTVLCRITRVQQRQASASILVVNPTPASVVPYTSSTNDELQYQALLRREDIRSFEKDRVVMNDMFRVGDIIRAFIISLGDERNYYISTAGNDFGVVVAKSDDGNAMIPSSWKEMRDVITGKGEARKVAKPA